MHRAKGLEFDCVMVVAPKSYLGVPEEAETQRKLLYVALTRAKRGAMLLTLGACRAWGVESENRPQRGQFLPDLQAHSPAMGQKDGESVASIKMDRCGRFAADAPQARQAPRVAGQCKSQKVLLCPQSGRKVL